MHDVALKQECFLLFCHLCIKVISIYSLKILIDKEKKAKSIPLEFLEITVLEDLAFNQRG